MHSIWLLPMIFSFLPSALGVIGPPANSSTNSTLLNPILPGFHPDPSCVFVSEWNNTFFCASSSFEAFPGVPIHASRDLQNWKLVGNALNRPEQIPDLAITNKSTSGIWAPALRFHNGTFYITTTLVFDDQPQTNLSRWYNILLSSNNPYNESSWTDPIHFDFVGYDTSLFWDSDGSVYVTGSHPYNLQPGINQAPISLTTGAVGSITNVWNGTGGLAPEGPHVYFKDDWYYLMIAEGGTGLNHEEDIARSRNINGPYESNPANPIVTNANTSAYFQTVGHADLFQDANGNWWGCALSTRSGPEYIVYPMGRETVLTSVTWASGKFPVFTNVSGTETSWPLPPSDLSIPGSGPFINAPDAYTFPPGSTIPAHFAFWRLPISQNYVVSPSERPNSLRLTASTLNLTGYDGNYAATGQTFLGRRQVDSFFTYSVTLSFAPTAAEHEAGVSVFLVQSHHIDLGVVLLPSSSTSTSSANDTALTPYFRLRTTTSIPVPAPIQLTPVPAAWIQPNAPLELRLQIQACNLTHYAFGAAPVGAAHEMLTLGYGEAAAVSYGFTGTLVGVYATTNGGEEGGVEAYVGDWRYEGMGQVRD
ncbi:glycoside hydrolase family 43 protein [Viridothelium virens]|uniref:Glycoside hydrolase family 43 protein n=1 Tax=Viridothelium virens TaxID=1048519 RepID=A0A6A6GUM8_VIRVR|nr:glycoside hydrolase family 43 protein [Viridothelium virens]